MGLLSTPAARWTSLLQRYRGLLIGLVLVLAVLLGWAGYRTRAYFMARADLNAAQQAYEQQQWSQARLRVDACLRSRPEDLGAHLLAARIARHLDEREEAEKQLGVCETLAGSETQPIQVERALLRLQKGDLAGTEPFLRDCLAHDDPAAPEILDALSVALILDYRMPEAHGLLEDLLRRQPQNFEALMRYAQTAENQGMQTVAMQTLQRALVLQPDDPEVRLALAQKLIAIGQPVAARPHLNRLRDERPDDPAVLYTFARCLAEQRELDQAVALLDQLLEREPNNWSVLAERGRLALELDKPAEAEPFLRRAHDLAPPDQALATRLADCLRREGKEDEVRPYREEADRIRTDTLKALTLTERYRQEQPKLDAGLCQELGSILLRLGKTEDALAFFRKALKADPRHRPTHEALAAFFEKTGDFRRAAFHKQQLAQQP